MNILIYFENPISPVVGGTERAAYNLGRLLRKNAHKVVTLARYKKDFGDDLGMEVIYLPDERLETERNKKFIEEVVETRSIDILINEGGNTSDPCFINHKILDIDCKIITCLHFSVYQGYDKFFYKDFRINGIKNFLRLLKAPFLKRKVLKKIRDNYLFAIKHTDAFVVLSDRYIDQLHRLTGFQADGNNIFAIPNIVSFEPTEDNRKEKKILFVGRLQYKTKRVDRLLKAWKRCMDDHPDWSLEIVGDGPDRLYYEKTAMKLNLTHVNFVGSQNSLEYYKSASILALVSTHEGLPMTIIEGMSQGCVPVLFDSFATAPQIVKNRETGILVRPFRIKKYAHELDSLMRDEVTIKNMSGKAIDAVISFSENSIWEKWNNLFNSLK